MRRLLFIVIAAMGMFKGYSQALVQTYTDRCTGEVKVFSVPMNGATAIAFYSKSRTFTAAQFQNGELQAWLEETYQWWQTLSPCSTNNATTQTTQQTTSQATTNATNAASNATSGATQNTGTTNTNTNGTSGTTGSTSTGGGTTSGGGTSGSSSSSGSSGSSTGGGDSSSGSSGSSSSDNQSGSNNDSSGTDNSSGTGDSSNDNSSGGSEGSEGSSSEEGSSGGSSEEGSSEESKTEKKEEVKEEKKEESKDEKSDESKEEDSKEEESEKESNDDESEEDKEEDSEEKSNNEDEEEEDKDDKEKNLAPPIVAANVVTMQMIDGVLTNAASFGYSQSSLTGEDTYSANAMVWSNLKQFSLNISKSSVLFNWDRREDIMVLDPFTNKLKKFGEVAARGSVMKVQTVSLGYMRMFTTDIVTFGVSDVFLGQKDNFWKGFVGGYAVTGMAVFLDDNQYLGTAALTVFGTKPFVFKRLTVSPMIAYSMTPLTVDNITKKINFNEHGNYVLGSNFDFNITQRFKANIGGTVIGSTMPGMPLSWALTIGSRFQF